MIEGFMIVLFIFGISMGIADLYTWHEKRMQLDSKTTIGKRCVV